MFNVTEDRLDYSKVLLPPSGYTCDFAIGTTYSLDLEALLGVPLALFFTEDMDGSLQDNPISLLEGIRRGADKFALFCEGGQIKVPHKTNPVFSLLEDSIFEVTLKNGKSFHPKVWLIKYVNTDTEVVIYRVVVLSRNLTFDRSWDIAVALEGKLIERRTKKNQPLIDFISFLHGFTTNRAKKKIVASIIEELPYVKFDTGDSRFADFDFMPLGISPEYSRKSTELFDTYHDLLVISPFLTTELLNDINNLSLSNPNKTLITRRSEVYKLTEELIRDIECYCLKDTILDGEEAISEEGSDKDYPQRQDIHAKLYFKSKHNQHHLYLGSANCSYNAFHGNIEFMIRLNYQKRGFRVSQVIDELFGRNDKEDDDRRNPFEKITELPSIEQADTNIEDQLQKTIKALCRANLKAAVTENRGVYHVTIEIHERHIPSDVTLSIAMLGGGSAAPLTSHTELKGLSLLQLSEFYIVKAGKEDQALQRVIKIPTTGIPEERDGAVIKSVIRDKATFLQYISFLLSDNYLLAALEQQDKHSSAMASWDLHMYDSPVLYENMLRAAARSPEKLKEIEALIKQISDQSIVPPEFEMLYQTFQKAVKRRGSR